MSNIIHTADLHIGRSKAILPEVYLERQIKMLYEIKRIVEEEQVSFLVIAGDVFDKSLPTHDEKEIFLKWLVEMDALDFVKVIIINGNHDRSSADKTALDYLNILKTKWNNIKIALKPSVFRFGQLGFVCIPSGFQIESYVDSLTEKIEGKVETIVGIAHIPFNGIQTDTGYQVKGQKIDASKVDYWLLGDIHKRFISSDNKIQMVGSPIQHDWLDLPDKGISLIDTNNFKPTLIPLSVTKLEITKDIQKAKESKNIVKFIGQATDEEIENTNIVEVTNFLDDREVLEYKSDFDVIEGLPDFLAEQGLSLEQQQQGVKLIEKICEKL